MRKRTGVFVSGALALIVTGCAPKPATISPSLATTELDVSQPEPAESAQTKAVSDARQKLSGSLEDVSPQGDVNASPHEYFEVGRSDVRFLVWDGYGEDKNACVLCQSFDGQRATTVWKEQLYRAKPGEQPHGGALRRIILTEGWQVRPDAPAPVVASLDKAVAYAGYHWSMPGGGFFTWVVSPTGVATKEEFFGLKVDAKTHRWSCWYPVSRAERKELGWK